MLIDEDPSHRGVVQRKALLHAPPAVISWAITIWLLQILFGGDKGALVGLSIIVIFTVALTFETIAALRDLRAEPITTQGIIGRTWTKGRFLFIGRIYYLAVEGRIFQLRRHAFASLQEGDTVKIEHWPRTNVIVTLHLAPSQEDESGSRRAGR